MHRPWGWGSAAGRPYNGGVIRESGTGATRQVLAEAWNDGRLVGRRLLATDLVFKLLAFVVLTPLVGLALEAGVAASGGPVLADMEILFFLLRPLGLCVLFGVAALSIAIVALEQSCLMAIAMGAAEGAHLRSGQVLRFALSRARPVVGLAARLVGRALALAAPFLAGIGLVYLGLLRDFDINFYLRQRPPAFLAAVTLCASLVLALAWVLLPRLVAWSLALPLVLFADVAPGRALAESAQRTAGRRGSIARLLLLWAAVAVGLSLSLPGAIFALGRLLAPYALGHVGWVLACMLFLVALWLLTQLLLTFWNAASFALLVVRLYRNLGGGSAGLRGPFAAAEGHTGGAIVQLGPARLLAALVVLGAAVGGALYLQLDRLRARETAVVIGHRGAAAAAPENTLAAVESGLAQGADYVEIDVQETADGAIAVVHDSDLMRVAGADVKIWAATRESLAPIDIGSWFGPGFAAERVPLLSEVLERARSRGKVLIELKYYGHDERLEQRVVDLVEQAGQVDEVAFMSLEYEQVKKMRTLRPSWTVGLLTAKAVGDLTALDADFLAVNAGIATRRFVQRAHGRGKKVYVWTLNDPVQMFRMLNLGVDGLITDKPALARWVIERRSGLSTVERLLVGLAFHFGAAAPDPPASVDAPGLT